MSQPVDPTSPEGRIWSVLILVYARGRADGARLGDRFSQEEFTDAVVRSGALEALQETKRAVDSAARPREAP